jgi:hypothetical protein
MAKPKRKLTAAGKTQGVGSQRLTFHLGGYALKCLGAVR